MTYCCSVFPKIAKYLAWHTNTDGSMSNPHKYQITYDYYYAVNFCPSCGADIRGIVITKDEFDKLK